MRRVFCGLVCLALCSVGFIVDVLAQSWLLPKDVRFRPDGKIGTDKEAGQYETGLYNNVWYYFVFKDASGYFQWQTVSTKETPRKAEGKPKQKDKLKAAREDAQKGMNELLQSLQELREGLGRMWSVGCKKDLMNDRKSCAMYQNDLTIFVNHEKQPYILIGSEHDPGSPVAIRINEDKPLVSDEKRAFGLDTSSLIIEKLKTNPRVAIRYKKWSDNHATDQAFQVFGFLETYEYLHWALNHIQ